MYFNNILRAHFNFDSPKMNEWTNDEWMDE